MNHKTILKLLKGGKKVYVGYYMNDCIDVKPLVFEDDREAIQFYANDEAAAYRFLLTDDGRLTMKKIYDPFD